MVLIITDEIKTSGHDNQMEQITWARDGMDGYYLQATENSGKDILECIVFTIPGEKFIFLFCILKKLK